MQCQYTNVTLRVTFVYWHRIQVASSFKISYPVLMPTITQNKEALHTYEVIETYEAGMVLTGPEVRSIKRGSIQLKGSYCSLSTAGELFLKNAHISAYKPAASVQRDYTPTHTRKLLLSKQELRSLIGKLQAKGITLIPLRVYTTRGLIKAEIGLCRGRKIYDKREVKKKKDLERDVQQELRKKTPR